MRKNQNVGFSESSTGETAKKAVYLCWTEMISHVKAADSTVSKTKDIKPLWQYGDDTSYKKKKKP